MKTLTIKISDEQAEQLKTYTATLNAVQETITWFDHNVCKIETGDYTMNKLRDTVKDNLFNLARQLQEKISKEIFTLYIKDGKIK